MEGMLTASEAAELLGCSSAWVRAACADGRIPKAQKHGTSWVIPARSLKGVKVQDGPGNPNWRASKK